MSCLLYSISQSLADTNFLFLNNVTFSNNHATDHDSRRQYDETCDAERCDVTRPTDGGALRITIVVGAQNCVVQIVNCTFTKNSGSNGGAVFVEQQKFIHKSLVVFSGCNFTENKADGGTSEAIVGDCGAVAILSMMTKFNQKFSSLGYIKEYEDVNFVITSSIFTGNVATRNGGAVCMVRLCDFDWERTTDADSRSRFGGCWLVLNKVKFFRNVAQYNGAGVYALGSILDGVQPPTLLLSDV